MDKIFVCPMPDTWNEIFQALLTAWKMDPKGKGPPPTPLILGGWNFSGDYEKKAVWQNTINWAEEIGLAHLIPVITKDQSYCVHKMEDYLWPSDTWNYDPRDKPNEEEVNTALEELKANWQNAVGEELARITKPFRFTGKKRRRLLVFAEFSVKPPWGTWTKINTEHRGKEFLQFRKNINKIIAPLEVDHIDFIPRDILDKINKNIK